MDGWIDTVILKDGRIPSAFNINAEKENLRIHNPTRNGSERLRNLQRNLQCLHKTLPKHKSGSQRFRSSPMFVLYFSISFMINPENTKEINV